MSENTAGLRIYQDSYVDATIISNRFIDEYMADANDAQLKVYLYLIRMLSARLQTGISDIADRFNHTEKDVIRALKYWEKKGLLSLEYDSAKTLCGIRLHNLCRGDATSVSLADTHAPMTEASPEVMPSASLLMPSPALSAPLSAPAGSDSSEKSDAGSRTVTAKASGVEAAPSAISTPPTHRELTLDEVFTLRRDPAIDQLIWVVEAYVDHPLSQSELSTLLYIRQDLGFSDKLVDALFDYCVERGKKSFRYIEKVAISWHEKNVTTPEEAKNVASRYDQEVYQIMNHLGKNNSPTDKEFEFIFTWRSTYGFTTEVILEACDRTVLATDQRRFQYAEGILSSWFKAGVHSKADIEKLDSTHTRKPEQRAGASSGTASAGSNRFNQFPQNDIDFAALEAHLFSN